MVVDLLDVDRDLRVIGRDGHGLLEDAGTPPRGERDVPDGEDHDCDLRALA